MTKPRKFTPLQIAILRAAREGVTSLSYVPGFRNQCLAPLAGLVEFNYPTFTLTDAGRVALAEVEAR